MKGQVYSLIVMFLAVPLLLFTAFYITSSQGVNSAVAERVVADQEHEIEKSIEDDFARALEISAKRGLIAASDRVIATGVAMDNAASSMGELIMNGTLEGNDTYVMINNSLGDWKDRILGIDIGFELDLEFNGLLIENHDGFNLKLELDMFINVSDSLNISRIDRRVNKEALASVEGIEDPLFPLNSRGYVDRIISRYPYPYYARKIVTGTGDAGCSGSVSFDPSSPSPQEILVAHNASGVSGFGGVVSETADLPSVPCHIAGAANAVDEINRTILESGYNSVYLDNGTLGVWSLPLIEGIDRGYYYPGAGPDILQRLEANLSENERGLETFVNIEELIDMGIEIEEGQSLVDHLYFSPGSHAGSAVRGFPDWFRIDNEHALLYNISELL